MTSPDERSGTDKMLRLPVEVTIGGRKFELEPKGLRASGKWIAKVLKAAEGLGLNMFELKGASATESINLMVLFADAVFDYADWTESEKKWVDDHATFDQMSLAFFKLLSMVAPSPPDANPQMPVGETSPIGETNGLHGDGSALTSYLG